MRAQRTFILLLVTVGLMTSAIPMAGAQATPDDQRERETSIVDFYGHVFGHGNVLPMPANVEAPVGEDMYGLGTFDWCTPAGGASGFIPPTPEPDEDCENNDDNTLVLYSTAGFVDVNSRSEFINDGGYGQLHNERGQTKPILLDTTKDISARIFLSLDAHAWPVAGGETNCFHPHPEGAPCAYPYWGWDVMAQPDFQVTAKLYHAQLGEWKANAAEAPPISDVLASGEATLIAEGATDPSMAVDGIPGRPNVLQFDIDLGSPQIEEIPKTHDFFLVYQFQSNTNGQTWSAHTWRIWAGEFFPPKFTLPVKNAFDVEAVIPNFVHGKLVTLGVISTPWGSYDVDPDATKLTIQDEDGNVITPQSIETFADYSVAHGGHFQPANVTYVWDYLADDLDPGTYTATVSAQNYQGSADAECTATFTVQKNGKPGPTEPGRCGFQTLTEEQKQELQEGAQDQADGDGDKRALGAPAPLPNPAGAVIGGLASIVLFPLRRWGL